MKTHSKPSEGSAAVRASWFAVETPEAAFLWLGTAARRGKYVWLGKPDGAPLLRVPRRYVRAISKTEAARRIIEDRKAALAERKAPWN